MKTVTVAACAAFLAASTFSMSAQSATYNTVGGTLLENARGGLSSTELGQASDNDVVNNYGVDFDVKGYLGNAYSDYFTFTMNKAFNMTLDLFVRSGTADATYAFSMTGQTTQNISTPQAAYGLYSNLAAGTYTFGITSPNRRIAEYDISVSAVPLPAALPLYGAGIAVLGFMGWRRKRNVSAAA